MCLYREVFFIICIIEIGVKSYQSTLTCNILAMEKKKKCTRNTKVGF